MQDPNNFEAYDPGGISAAPPATFTPRDILVGHLAAVIPGLPQTTLESAADGLTILGYRTPDPAEYRPVLTEDAIEAGANQMRSQIGDFTSPDILMRKRSKFVLRAAIPYLGVEQAR